ncbi:hypothetical protein MHYP_G00200360 [Metynnis hypsauchen]
MRMQITVYVLLLMLLQKVTGHGEQQNIKGTTEVTAVPGVCALIPCAFNDSGINNITKEMWYKCSDEDCKNSTEIKDKDFKRWPEDPLKNCSMIIDRINSNDSGYYKYRPLNKSQYLLFKVTIQEKPMTNVTPLTDGKPVTLNCSVPNPCPTAHPQIKWMVMKVGSNSTSPFNDSATTNVTLSNGDITSTLTFTPPFDMNDSIVQCVVNYGNITTYTNWTLAVTHVENPRSTGPPGKTDGQSNQGSKVQQCDDNKVTLRTIFSFLAGASSTAIIVCVVLCCVCICQRCRTLKATDGNTNIKLEAVKVQQSQADADNVGANEQTPLQKRRSEEAKSTGSGGLEEEDMPGEDRNLGVDEAAGEVETKEVDYACIDYSLIQKRQAEDQKPKSEDTEYAEIQIKKQAEGEGDELLQDGMDQSASRLKEGVESQEQDEEEEVEV